MPDSDYTWTEEQREEVARILKIVAANGLPEPRDLDVALDAILEVVRQPVRLCLVCGYAVDADKYKRGDWLTECEGDYDGKTVAPCTFDYTSDEAIKFLRSELHRYKK